MSARVGLPVASTLILALAWAAAASAKGEKPVYDDRLLEPDLRIEGPPFLEGSTWVQSGIGWQIRLTKIDDDLRLQYLERVSGLTVDPFRGRPGRPPGYITFLLEIHNNGRDAILFNPLKCWLFSVKAEIRTPLGMSDVSFNYRMAGGDLPPAYERIGPALLDRNRTIEPGSALHGLLVYRTLEKPRTKRYSVSVELALPSGDVVRFAAPYRRPSAKEKRAAASEER